MELYPGKGSAPVNCQRSSSLPYSRIDGGDDPNPLSDLRLDQSSTFPSDPTLTGQPNADNNCARQYYEGPIQVTISPIHTKNNTPSLAFQGSPSPSSGPPNVDVIATNEDVKINITHPPANGQNNQVISVRQACPPPCSPPACTPVCSPCQPCPSPCIPTCPPCAIPCQPPCFPLCAPCPKPCPPCPSACYACIPCPQPPPATGEQAKAEKSPPMVCYPQTCCPMAQPVCYGPMAEGQYVFVQPCCCCSKNAVEASAEKDADKPAEDKKDKEKGGGGGGGKKAGKKAKAKKQKGKHNSSGLLFQRTSSSTADDLTRLKVLRQLLRERPKSRSSSGRNDEKWSYLNKMHNGLQFMYPVDCHTKGESHEPTDDDKAVDSLASSGGRTLENSSSTTNTHHHTADYADDDSALLGDPLFKLPPLTAPQAPEELATISSSSSTTTTATAAAAVQPHKPRNSSRVRGTSRRHESQNVTKLGFLERLTNAW